MYIGVLNRLYGNVTLFCIAEYEHLWILIWAMDRARAKPPWILRDYYSFFLIQKIVVRSIILTPGFTRLTEIYAI